MLPGGQCRRIARWHIIWSLGGAASGSLACDIDRAYAEEHYNIDEIHAFAPPCDSVTALWFRAEHLCREPVTPEDRVTGQPVL